MGEERWGGEDVDDLYNHSCEGGGGGGVQGHSLSTFILTVFIARAGQKEASHLMAKEQEASWCTPGDFSQPPATESMALLFSNLSL